MPSQERYRACSVSGESSVWVRTKGSAPGEEQEEGDQEGPCKDMPAQGYARSAGASASGGPCGEVRYRRRSTVASHQLCYLHWGVLILHPLTQFPQKEAGWMITPHPWAHSDGAPCLPRGAVLGWPCLVLLTERSWSRCAAMWSHGTNIGRAMLHRLDSLWVFGPCMIERQSGSAGECAFKVA